MEKDIITIDSTQIEYDRDALIDAIKAANKNAWLYRGCQYSVYLWDDGTITRHETFAGDNSWLAARDAHHIYTVTHHNDHPEDFDCDWREDVVSRLSADERAEYDRLVDADEDADTYLLDSAAYRAHYDDLVDWLANDEGFLDSIADIIDRAADDYR